MRDTGVSLVSHRDGGEFPARPGSVPTCPVRAGSAPPGPAAAGCCVMCGGPDSVRRPYMPARRANVCRVWPPMGKRARIRQERAEKREQEGVYDPGPKAGANRGALPPWMPAPGATVADADDEITKIGQFLNAQPQLMVCGHLGLKPLTDEKRRDLLAGVNLYDALGGTQRAHRRWRRPGRLLRPVHGTRPAVRQTTGLTRMPRLRGRSRIRSAISPQSRGA